MARVAGTHFGVSSTRTSFILCLHLTLVPGGSFKDNLTLISQISLYENSEAFEEFLFLDCVCPGQPVSCMGSCRGHGMHGDHHCLHYMFLSFGNWNPIPLEGWVLLLNYILRGLRERQRTFIQQGMGRECVLINKGKLIKTQSDRQSRGCFKKEKSQTFLMCQR